MGPAGPGRRGRHPPPQAAPSPIAFLGELFHRVDHVVVQGDEVADQGGGAEAPALATRQDDLEVRVQVQVGSAVALRQLDLT